jgi:adenylylsulfate kinase
MVRTFAALESPAAGQTPYTRQAKHNQDIVFHEALFTKEERTEMLSAGHSGCTVWITGLSGSGKSTIAAQVEKELLLMGVRAYRLDGDNVRFGLNKDLGFAAEDREENIRRVSNVAALMADSGLVTLTAFISPYKESRDHARAIHEEQGIPFIEVHAHVSLEGAMKRDPKGLYQKAIDGKIPMMTGIGDSKDSRFDEPEDPELKLHTEDMSVVACAGAIISEIKSRGIISGNFKLAPK